jgi:hypothetical protein
MASSGGIVIGAGPGCGSGAADSQPRSANARWERDSAYARTNFKLDLAGGATSGPMFAAEVCRKRVQRMPRFTHWRWHLDEAKFGEARCS